MIPLRDQEVLRQRFKTDLTSRVRIDFFTQRPVSIYVPGRQDCQYCKEAQTLMEEVASLSERVALTVHDLDETEPLATTLGIDKVPAMVIRGQTNRPIRFFGLPSGTGFPVFIETLLDAARGSVELRPETVRQLRKLKTDVQLHVLVTTACPYSPQVAGTATKLALQSNRVKVDIVEVAEFPALIRHFNVRAVPTTVFDERLVVAGTMDEATLVETIFSVVEGKPFSGQARTGPATSLIPPQAAQPPGARSAGGGSSLILPR